MVIKLYLPKRCTNRREVQLSRFKKLSHTIYECKYHIVFCPKYRLRIFREEIKNYTEYQLRKLLDQKDKIELMELYICEDHIHMVVSIPPKYSLSSLLGFLKGKLALRLLHHYESLQGKYWGRHIWSRGYCVSTVGLNEEQIRKYVRYQEKNDKRTDQYNLEI
jgi:putative transposase